MADLLVDTQGVPANPAAGQGLYWFDTTGLIPCYKNQNGDIFARSENVAVAAQGPGFAADTYLTNSDILIPSFGLQPKTLFRWTISVAKTAAGAATPIYQVRIGANRTTADTSRLTLTGLAQTAAADVALINIYLTVRSNGAAGVMQGTCELDHQLAITGFANNNSSIVEGTGAAFDMTSLPGLFIGISINGGASAAWTVTQARTEAKW